MAVFNGHSAKTILIGYMTIFCCLILADGDKIGVNYGMDGDNLPSAGEVVSLLTSNNIGKMRIFEANQDALKAFSGSGIEVIVGVANSDLQAISSSQDSANGWVNDNIVAFYPATNIKYIAVGNEVLTGSTQDESYLVPAMTNIQLAIQNANLQSSIKVSTTHASGVTTGYPPSNGAFGTDVKDTINQILKFLSDNGGPFRANVYPYFSYIGNPNDISLDYALFKSTSTVVQDGDLSYSNLFDALTDTFLSAIEGLGSYSNIPIVITESGWPSSGADVATIDNAKTYNNNLISHVLSTAGTPKRPGTSIETYVFAVFNEDLKQGAETERNFGLFYPDKQPVYSVNFSP